MIKYIGSKRRLIPQILQILGALREEGTVVDLFSGTARVGHGMKASGYQVLTNDINHYAYLLSRTYVEADAGRWEGELQRLLPFLNQLPGERGYITKTFCERSRFFQPFNGFRIDAIRRWIHEAPLHPELEAILLVSLMEASDRVDSTTGIQMAYLKKWSRRSHNALELRPPALLEQAASGPGKAHQGDALAASRELSGHIAYLDPPYNQHKYLGNYHIWETLCRWDAPEVYGKAQKRIDCKVRKSPFNSRPRIKDAMAQVLGQLDVEHLVVSFNNEGFLDRDALVDLLAHRGEVFLIEQPYPRYVGARIGIHNPEGQRVGEVSHLQNKEFLFVVPAKAAVDRVAKLEGAHPISSLALPASP